MDRDAWALSMAEHEEILTALKNRNGPQLAQALRTHLNGKANTIETWLDEG